MQYPFKRVAHCLLLGFFILQNVPLTANAWNAKGHVQISQMAFDYLSQKSKVQVDAYAEYLFSQLHENLQWQLEDSYKGAVLFAKLSTLPDSWRQMTIENLFKRFSAPLPEILKPHRNDTTNAWHFEDHVFPKNHRCQSPNQQNLHFALIKLTQAWDQTQDEKSRSVILILITHFIEDAHQPLHMLSKMNRRCEGDAGGNKHPIEVGRHKKINLHQLWDSGVGYLNHRANYEVRAQSLAKEFPPSFFKKKITYQEPEIWATEDYSYGKFIYTAKKNKSIKPSYYQQGQTIARQQMALAAYRLAFWMNAHG